MTCRMCSMLKQWRKIFNCMFVLPCNTTDRWILNVWIQNNMLHCTTSSFVIIVSPKQVYTFVLNDQIMWKTSIYTTVITSLSYFLHTCDRTKLNHSVSFLCSPSFKNPKVKEEKRGEREDKFGACQREYSELPACLWTCVWVWACPGGCHGDSRIWGLSSKWEYCWVF